jgi:hypothetical protein
MRKLLPCAVVLCALSLAPVQAQERSPIIYNAQGNEVGVIQRNGPGGDPIVLPAKATLDLGYYDVVFPSQALRPRHAGGWETSLTNEEIAYLQPVPHQFFQRSGD